MRIVTPQKKEIMLSKTYSEKKTLAFETTLLIENLGRNRM